MNAKRKHMYAVYVQIESRGICEVMAESQDKAAEAVERMWKRGVLLRNTSAWQDTDVNAEAMNILSVCHIREVPSDKSGKGKKREGREKED